MQTPLRMTFRDMPHSDALEAYVRRHCEKLEQLSNRITACHVTVSLPHQHDHADKPVRVSIDLVLPGVELAVAEGADTAVATTDARSAVDQAFEQAGRRLHDYVQRQRGDVKVHASEYQEARVSGLWTHEGYGFLTTADDLEVYFHRHSVLHHAFERIQIGSKVRFIEEQGDKGPQASTVVLTE